jgi:hypothetical protein
VCQNVSCEKGLNLILIPDFNRNETNFD